MPGADAISNQIIFVSQNHDFFYFKNHLRQDFDFLFSKCVWIWILILDSSLVNPSNDVVQLFFFLIIWRNSRLCCILSVLYIKNFNFLSRDFDFENQLFWRIWIFILKSFGRRFDFAAAALVVFRKPRLDCRGNSWLQMPGYKFAAWYCGNRIFYTALLPA